MAEDPTKTGGAQEERGPEQGAEQIENAQEFLARKSRELQEMIDGIKDANDTELNQAIFARMEKVLADFNQTAPRIIEQAGEESDAIDRIRQRFETSKDEVMQHSDFLAKPAASPDTTEPRPEASVEGGPEFEDLINDVAVVEENGEVNNVIGTEILVKSGASFTVHGGLVDSIIRVEPGGIFSFHGAFDNSDIITDYIESAEPEENAKSEPAPEAPSEPAAETSEPLGGGKEKVELEDSVSPEASDSDDAAGDTFEEQIAAVNISIPEPSPKAPSEQTATETAENIDTAASVESLEADLGYLNLDPSKVFENLEAGDIEQLKTRMTEYRVAETELQQARANLAQEEGQKKPNEENLGQLREKVAALEASLKEKKEVIDSFYKEKITAILAEEGRAAEIDEESLGLAAERINQIVLDTISLEASRLSVDSKLKTMGKQMLKSAPLMIGASIAIGTLGLSLPITGLLAGSTSWVIRRMMAGRSKKNTPKQKLEHAAKVDEKKTELTTALFSDVEALRSQLSGHISNALRQQTSERALAALASIEKTDEEEVLGPEQLGEVTREFYLSALTQVDAKYPGLDQQQRHNMAINLAMNLSQHQRGQSEAIERLAKIKTEKPGLYKIIEKYNLLSGTGRIDEPPADMTEEEKKVWGISKYDLLSFGMGGGVGMAVRSSQVVRTALGAFGGGALGYVLGEELERKSEGKAFKEIEAMINEAESMIKDLSFPESELDGLREYNRIVKARLETGILNNNPLLKSRAENFVANFQRVELANQATIDSLLATLSKNAQELELQIKVDVDRIEKATKSRRLIATVGGTLAGGLLGYFGADLSKQALDGLGDLAEELGIKDEAEGIIASTKDFIDDAKEKVGLDTDRGVAPLSPDSQAPETEPATATDPERTDWGRPMKYVHGQGHREIGPDIDESASPGGFEEEAQAAERMFEGKAGGDPGEVGASAGGDPVASETPPEPTSFSDKIDSTELKGSDSIWRSTKAIFMKNADALGYKGDPAGLDAWAENQTANAVAELNEAQGGNLTDLVHKGNVVHLDRGTDGNWHLRLDDSEGGAASQLSDTNVDKFFEGTKFEGDVEHTHATDPRTGDQYWELKAGEDTYKIYDWDRDGRPNIIMPDGSSTEMSLEEMKAFLQEKNISFTQEEVDIAAATNRFEQFIASGHGGKYEAGMYQMAQADPLQSTALFEHVMADNDPAQIEGYLRDYLKASTFSDNKADIFLATLRDGGTLDKTLGGAFDGKLDSLDNLRSTFDSSVRTTYDSLNDVNAKEWHPIEIKGEYYLAYKYHEGTWPFRSDHYYLSNGSVDASGSYVVQDQLDGHAMEDYFTNGSTKDLASYPGDAATSPDAQPAPADETPKDLGEKTDFKPVKAVGDVETKVDVQTTGPAKDLGMPEKNVSAPRVEDAVPGIEERQADAATPAVETKVDVQTTGLDKDMPDTGEAQFFYTGGGKEGDIVVGDMDISGPSPIFRYNSVIGKYESVNYPGSWPEGLTQNQLADLGSDHPIGQVSQNGEVSPVDDSLGIIRMEETLDEPMVREVSTERELTGPDKDPGMLEKNVSTPRVEDAVPGIEEQQTAVAGDSHAREPKDLFEEAEDGQVTSSQSKVETTPAADVELPPTVEVSSEDINSALAVLAKGFKVDQMTLEQIRVMDNPDSITKLGAYLNSLIEKAEADPAQAHTLRGLEYLRDVVDSNLVEINSADSALSVLSAGEKLQETLTLRDIEAMDDLKALEGLRGKASDMIDVISGDADLSGDVGGFQRVIAAIDKRIIDIKA